MIKWSGFEMDRPWKHHQNGLGMEASGRRNIGRPKQSWRHSDKGSGEHQQDIWQGPTNREQQSLMESYHKGEQGWCSGENTRLPLMRPRFKSLTRHHTVYVGWVCYWFSSLLRGFSYRVLRRLWGCPEVKFIFHWHLFKTVKPVLRGQLAITRGWAV